MKAERLALLFVIVLVIGVPLAAVLARSNSDTIEIHAQMADNGGWTPSDLKAQVGQPLHLRLTSDDVMHGFAVGQSDAPALDVLPGQWTTTTLVFNQPGKYTFYCTRWCGPNHWRMRGTIEVTGDGDGNDHCNTAVVCGAESRSRRAASSDVVPSEKPSAARGAALGLDPDRLATPARTQSPAQVWHALRSSPVTRGLNDTQVWDLVALTWRTNTTPETIGERPAVVCAELRGLPRRDGQRRWGHRTRRCRKRPA